MTGWFRLRGRVPESIPGRHGESVTSTLTWVYAIRSAGKPELVTPGGHEHYTHRTDAATGGCREDRSDRLLRGESRRRQSDDAGVHRGRARVGAPAPGSELPAMDLRTVTVTVPSPGSSPREVEQDIVRRVEESVVGLAV